jgi:hypothetical protein
MRKIVTVLILLALIVSLSPTVYAAYQMKQAPLMTAWSAQVSPANALPEYPRPQMTRSKWLNLNGEWEFSGATAGQSVPTGQTLPESILVPYPVESALSGIMRKQDRMWYKRSFTIPTDWSGQRVILNFGAVDWHASVYVNGQLAGEHKGGYDSFSFDITDRLRAGSNELIVNVFDPSDAGNQPVGKQTNSPGGIFYTSNSGIWQTVWLEPVPAARIDRLDMTPDVPGGNLKLTVRGSGVNGQTVEAVVSSGGIQVGTATGQVGSEVQITVPNARLWSPDDPFLYDLTVRLKSGSTVVDQVGSYFGMRSIGLKSMNGVLRPVLNGNFVFQMGTLDQGYWPDGIYTAPTDAALRFDIEKHKELGYNLIRKHIKVEPARWFYWADRLGVLVWQDMPSMRPNLSPSAADKTQYELELKEMIDEHRSFSSVIMWVVFNEGWAQYDAAETTRLTNWVKGYDPTRLANNASGWHDSGAGDVVDWHNYVGPASPVPTNNRFAAQGEFGGLGLKITSHMWSPNGFGYQMMNSTGELNNRYLGLMDHLSRLMISPGLSAAIYTEITDVEDEVNGMLTYDRAVMKADIPRVKAAHESIIQLSKLLNTGIPATTSFADDFNDGNANGWTSYGGSWSVSNGELTVNSGPGYKSLPFTYFNDFTYEADVTIASGTGDAGVIFRAKNPAVGTDSYQGYYAGIATNGQVVLGKSNNNWTLIGSAPMTIAAGTKYRIKVEALGTSIKVFVNDMVTPKITAIDNSYLGGQTGVRVYQTSARFDNVTIEDKIFRFETSNMASNFIRHMDSRVRVSANVNPFSDSEWKIVPGLADPNAFSFESVNFPGQYLRHRNGEVWIDPYSDTNLYKADATWWKRPGLSDANLVSFESYNFPGQYLRHRDYLLYKEAITTDLDRRDATFLERR